MRVSFVVDSFFFLRKKAFLLLFGFVGVAQAMDGPLVPIETASALPGAIKVSFLKDRLSVDAQSNPLMTSLSPSSLFAGQLRYPQAVMIHPYHPQGRNGVGLQPLHSEDKPHVALSRVGIASVPFFMRFPSDCFSILPDGVKALLSKHQIAAEFLDISFVAQNCPWRDQNLCLRPHYAIDGDRPFSAAYEKKHIVFATLVGDEGDLPFLRSPRDPVYRGYRKEQKRLKGQIRTLGEGDPAFKHHCLDRLFALERRIQSLGLIANVEKPFVTHTHPSFSRSGNFLMNVVSPRNLLIKRMREQESCSFFSCVVYQENRRAAKKAIVTLHWILNNQQLDDIGTHMTQLHQAFPGSHQPSAQTLEIFFQNVRSSASFQGQGHFEKLFPLWAHVLNLQRPRQRSYVPVSDLLNPA